MFVYRTEVAGLAGAVPIIPCDDDLITEDKQFAPAVFEVFRGGRIQKSVLTLF